jgi:AraC family transcriptional activator FtrA
MVAQRLVVPAHREGGQAQYLPRPLPTDDRGRLSKLMDWVRTHPAAPHTLATLAKRASMSPRTLQRQFRETVGLAPHEWIVRERIGIAKDLLEGAGAQMNRVAEEVGFRSQESFRRHFRKITGTSPSAYRKQFSGSVTRAR